ncbi:Tetracycline repressor protein class A [Actinoplanes sp. SE50]|uniref:TetR/AcrR family transcriptional regulator n=1 Tax=unclassified Actinoplanes TaxID=2626549 RepID=UPI00023ECAA8|nr:MULTISPECIES: TetR/AcrR family transcriptional regulator [unclassified Actinoplanes]AEV82612.1 Tetracycline repressor protein class A [Actinoplanes sp. SE50/110]ATO81008.1 Tetracycline repressor protein class A [Actinoplanes sp. SE50]SLL98415.1 Tetracycline repressor protein class A [Actinoplanes sp. SE50/110]
MVSELPRTLKVLWGVAERPTRGPQPALSLDRIVAAAIGIADRDGLAALSMARLAERLGCAPMSLYRHVANKDELLVFMQDAAPGEPPRLPPGWRDGLAAWARALRAVLAAHPWILQATAGRPPLEPGQLAWLDRGLSAFAGTPLSHRLRGEMVMAALYLARGEAQISAVLLSGVPDVVADYGALLARFVTAERFPALAEAVADGAFAEAAGPDESFEIGLARLLDGIELLMSTFD